MYTKCTKIQAMVVNLICDTFQENVEKMKIQKLFIDVKSFQLFRQCFQQLLPNTFLVCCFVRPHAADPEEVTQFLWLQCRNVTFTRWVLWHSVVKK